MRIKITDPMHVKEMFRDKEYEVVNQSAHQYGVDSGNSRIGTVWFHFNEVTVIEE